MSENLKTTVYNNGASIPKIESTTSWQNATTHAYCWNDNNEASNKDLYGALYNGYAIETGNLCPSGWHVPSDNEWKTLEKYAGMSQAEADGTSWRGTNEGTKLKATSGWDAGGDGTDNYGFSGRPGGYRGSNGDFGGIGLGGLWWSSTEFSSTQLYYRTLGFDHADVERWYLTKNAGFSVRCVKD